ncbi:YtpI family protein [Bacillus alkalicellulosilyticus]|uniref:YtpI family protein n=1 Tax=Alkalihalobacterium alkalicellulosilyticum TaxID=1912214 RepID=UPI000997EF08|nr:YtpI family protein [Bacillus alkalicellulosilyticus]
MAQSFFILIIIFAVFFLYFKVKVWKTKAPLEKKWLQTKANMSLGAFLVAYGLNSLYFPRSTLEIVVGIVFVLLGAANIFFGYKAYKHYLPYVIEESKSNKA